MRALTLSPTDDTASPGDLRARVVDGRLLVPRQVAAAARDAGVRTAADLLSYMQSFPSAVADQLHWSAADVTAATQRLQNDLRGHVEPEILAPPQRKSPVLGARDPAALPPARKQKP